jgi:hypothetical protein
MRVPYIDLHGYTIDEAVTQFHVFVGHHLINDEADYIEIITGNGIIKERIIEELDSMELEYVISVYNLGKITVVLKD